MTKNTNEEINVLDYFMEKIDEGGSTIGYVFNNFKSDELANAIYEQNKQIQRLKQENEKLQKDLALEREDCASACPNVRLMERYAKCLEEIRELLLDGGNCYREQMELRFAVLDKINEVLDGN